MHKPVLITDNLGLKHFLRRLYFAQISMYNIEQWYDSLVKLDPSSLPNHQGRQLTAATVFLPLDDQDLKVIQKLYTKSKSIIL